MEKQKEGVITIREKDELIAIIYKHNGDRPIIYRVEEMGDEEIADLFIKTKEQ